MLQIAQSTETKIIHAAAESGQSITSFLDHLLDIYTQDCQDINLADRVMKEEGGIALDELQAKYGL